MILLYNWHSAQLPVKLLSRGLCDSAKSGLEGNMVPHNSSVFMKLRGWGPHHIGGVCLTQPGSSLWSIILRLCLIYALLNAKIHFVLMFIKYFVCCKSQISYCISDWQKCQFTHGFTVHVTSDHMLLSFLFARVLWW